MMRRYLIVVLFIVFLGATGEVGGVEESVIFGRVVGVHDGDTVTILSGDDTQLKIRLEGIDAPELSQPYGHVSKAGLSALVFGNEIKVIRQGTDRYKRIIGRIIGGTTDLSVEMVRQGLAWHYEKYSKETVLIEVQAQAKAGRIGLWSEFKPIAPWEWRSKKVGIHRKTKVCVLETMAPWKV